MPRKTPKTNKTAQVLRLLTKSEENTPENPIINEEFKEEVIHSRTPAPKKKASPAEETSEKKINVVAELVTDWLPQTLRRFKCCDCDVCVAETTVKALNEIPPKYVIINNEEDAKLAERIKEECRPEVLKTLVRLAIAAQKNPKHRKIS